MSFQVATGAEIGGNKPLIISRFICLHIHRLILWPIGSTPDTCHYASRLTGSEDITACLHIVSQGGIYLCGEQSIVICLRKIWTVHIDPQDVHCGCAFRSKQCTF